MKIEQKSEGKHTSKELPPAGWCCCCCCGYCICWS